MNEQIEWTGKPVGESGYYFFSGYNRTTMGILYFDKNEKMVDGDLRSSKPIPLPAKPV